MNIVDECIAWNAARYERAYDYGLASRLLLEEIEELFFAPTKVEMLDAIGDITFVAIGVLWKLGFDESLIRAFFYQKDMRTMTMQDADDLANHVQLIALDILDGDMLGVYPGLALTCMGAFVIALGQLRGLGMQQHYYEIVGAICRSNATKEVRGKVDASVKANVVKGAGYEPPTFDLNLIIARHEQLKRLGGTEQ